MHVNKECEKMNYYIFGSEERFERMPCIFLANWRRSVLGGGSETVAGSSGLILEACLERMNGSFLAASD